MELGGVEFRSLAAKHFVRGNAARNHAHDAAVHRPLIVKDIGQLDRSAAGPVFYDDGRLTRNVVADIARQQTCIGIVSAAGGEADMDLERPTAVEFGDRVGAGRSGRGSNNAGNSHAGKSCIWAHFYSFRHFSLSRSDRPGL